MGSSKKKRGQQRKAAQCQAADTKGLMVVYDGDGHALIEKSQHDKCAKLVQMGDRNATNAVKDLIGLIVEMTQESSPEMLKCVRDVQRQAGVPVATPSADGTYKFDNISYESSGILTTVLNFLKRCEDETFYQVMSSASKGDLVSPVTWIEILLRAEEVEPSCRLQIADSIGPLVKCMCNDKKRIFFKHWKEGIEIFTGLIGNMISNSINDTDKKIVNTLIQHEGLLTSIVQWGFWKEHRPDITNVLSVGECAVINEMGIRIVGLFVNDTYRRRDTVIGLSSECKRLMWSIGTTPIVSREYDPACMTSYNEDFIRHTKEVEGFKMRHDLLLLQVLVTDIDCVDKGIITALIDSGINVASDYDSAAIIAGLIGYCLKESDTRVSFAIRFGLIEMCLGFIDRYGRVESLIDVDEISLSGVLKIVFTAISTISLHQKTSKAIRSKKIEIQGALARLERKSKVERALAGRTNDMNDDENDRNRLLLDMVRSILDISGSYCCWCNRSLSRAEVKQCNGCHRMTYCSRACQREDWLNGHKLTCNEPYTDEKVGLFQGRLQPTINEQFVLENERGAAKLKEIEINITKIQLKLFLDNAETILNEAISLDLDLCDCVVVFDLSYCPMQISVVKYTDYYIIDEMWEGFEKSRSEENITCVYLSRVCIRELDKGSLAMQRLFPHEWLKSKES